MLGSGTADGHFVGIAIQALLNRLEHRLVLPACDAPLRPRRALRLYQALRAFVCPIAADLFAVLLAGEAVGQAPAGGTAVDVAADDIDEVLLAETAGSLCAGGLRLGQRHCDAGILARL